MTGTLVAGGALGVAYAAAMTAVLSRGDKRRQRGAEHAGRAAVAAARAAEAAYRPRGLRILLFPNGAGGTWRWLVWDADPDPSSGRVEGVLVPFGIGDKGCATQDEALAEARAFVEAWTRDRRLTIGYAVEIPLVPDA